MSIAIPLGNNRHWDLIAELDERLRRVQVKTTRCRRRGRWEVTVATRGGNQSWSGVAKLLDRSRFDYLFVHVGDGRRWFIPAASVDGCSGVLLGGPKYAEFEVEPGDPIPARTDEETPSRIAS